MKKKDTRKLLLDSAYNTFYKHGYQGANVNSILKNVGINKGSMYHYFKSKKELGLAVVKERIEVNLMQKYEGILAYNKAVKTLFDTLKEAPETLKYGCPLNKMSQEMIYIDEDFKKSLVWVYEKYVMSVEEILKKGIEQNEINSYELRSTAQLIIATYEGALMTYHMHQDVEQYIAIISRLEEKVLNV